MIITKKMDVNAGELLPVFRDLFNRILKQDDIAAILVPQHFPNKKTVMPELVADPERLDKADPLSPAFFLNAARIVSKLTRKPAGAKIVAVLRPCEIRAFVELVKLKQASAEDLIILGTDCLGAIPSKKYADFAGDDGQAATVRFYNQMLSEKPQKGDLAAACQICDEFLPAGADIAVGLIGVNAKNQILVQAQTPAGKELIERLNLPEAQEPPERTKIIDSIRQERISARDKVFAETAAAVNNPDKLDAYLARCINCYNCRVACPICYCKECVFVTDVFSHEPSQYLKWARRKGSVKMPSDTLFYHLTRLAHMSASCVGCGQCSNACPNDIPLAQLFRMVSQGVRQAFDYEPGKSLEDKPPLSEFHEKEFEEVVGV